MQHEALPNQGPPGPPPLRQESGRDGKCCLISSLGLAGLATLISSLEASLGRHFQAGGTSAQG